MKNKIGAIVGFVLGVAGFMSMFKVFFLDHIPPEDEVPPGVVVFVAILNGFLFGFAGQLLQNMLGKRKDVR
jgi:hypothetical protein